MNASKFTILLLLLCAVFVNAALTDAETAKAKAIYASLFLEKNGLDSQNNPMTRIWPTSDKGDSFEHIKGNPKLKQPDRAGFNVYSRILMYIEVSHGTPALRMRFMRSDSVGQAISYVFHIDDDVVTVNPGKPVKRAGGGFEHYDAPADMTLISKIAKGKLVMLRVQGVHEDFDREIGAVEKRWMADMSLVYRYLKDLADARK